MKQKIFNSSGFIIQNQKQKKQLMQQTKFSSTKKSFFIVLKQTKEQFSKQIKLRTKKMKKHKFLKQQIYKNHNIFHTLTNVNRLSKTMTAQNIIWTKNYELKEGINKLKEENSSLKAKIWNVEKENRKMDRQIQVWGLKKAFLNTSAKPYIDTATAQKVLQDQDYSITSIKILIFQLEYQLENLSFTLEQSLNLSKNIKNINNDLKRELGNKKIDLYKFSLWDPVTRQYQINCLQGLKEEKKELLLKKNQQLEYINKNTELKRKSNLSLVEELNKINLDFKNLQGITAEKIQHLKQQAHKLRTQDESYVNEELKKIANIKQKELHIYCKTQDRMGEFIKEKIELTKSIRKYEQKILSIQASEQVNLKASPQNQKNQILRENEDNFFSNL